MLGDKIRAKIKAPPQSSTHRWACLRGSISAHKRGSGIYGHQFRLGLEDPLLPRSILHDCQQRASIQFNLILTCRLPRSPPELFTRVDQWAHEVVRCAEQHSEKRTRSSGSGMKLRSLQACCGLTETSVNPHSRKRKPSAALDGTDKAGAGKKAQMDSEPQKQRGRPPGSKNKAKRGNHDGDEFYNPPALSGRSLPPSIPVLPPPGSSAKPSSPSR
ncbi:hypothetical protein JMJ35_010180 [Cladonia borealis]|uniref:Uncharacterized protein n=1 Tax=Cladonia borealis TaxID=184061 RepID=A0AA39QQ97_9LECA|nr:hypothetical protein JMJ35_010180 [Cladonia borealis]